MATLDEKAKAGTLTLEETLESEYLSQELRKVSSDSTIQFLCQHENLKKMVQYLTTDLNVTVANDPDEQNLFIGNEITTKANREELNYLQSRSFCSWNPLPEDSYALKLYDLRNEKWGKWYYDPPQERDKDVSSLEAFHYPVAAHEVLSDDNPIFADAIVKNHELLDMLFDYFHTREPVHPVLGSYVASMLSAVFTRPELDEYLEIHQDSIAESLIFHLEHRGIAELLKILIFQERGHLKDPERLLLSLVMCLDPSLYPKDVLIGERQENTFLIFRELVHSRNSCVLHDTYMKILTRPDVVDYIMEGAFHWCKPVVAACIGTIVELLMYLDPSPEGEEELDDQLPYETLDDQNLHNLEDPDYIRSDLCGPSFNANAENTPSEDLKEDNETKSQGRGAVNTSPRPYSCSGEFFDKVLRKHMGRIMIQILEPATSAAMAHRKRRRMKSKSVRKTKLGCVKAVDSEEEYGGDSPNSSPYIPCSYDHVEGSVDPALHPLTPLDPELHYICFLDPNDDDAPVDDEWVDIDWFLNPSYIPSVNKDHPGLDHLVDILPEEYHFGGYQVSKKNASGLSSMAFQNGVRPLVGHRILEILHLFRAYIRLKGSRTFKFYVPKLLKCVHVLLFVHKWNSLLHISLGDIMIYALQRGLEHWPEAVNFLIEKSGFLYHAGRFTRRWIRMRKEVDLESRRIRRQKVHTGTLPIVLEVIRIIQDLASNPHNQLVPLLHRVCEDWSGISQEMEVLSEELCTPLGGTFAMEVPENMIEYE